MNTTTLLGVPPPVSKIVQHYLKEHTQLQREMRAAFEKRVQEQVRSQLLQHKDFVHESMAIASLVVFFLFVLNMACIVYIGYKRRQNKKRRTI
tara:strand:- start:3908 stop:4186 length:279 start_codon:yes stop_codon:yes gene_type:complete